MITPKNHLVGPDEIFNRVVNIRSTIVSEQEEYTGADIDKSDEDAIDNTIKNTVSFGWVCPLCNFESNNKDICVNCKAPINNYYKMAR